MTTPKRQNPRAPARRRPAGPVLEFTRADDTPRHLITFRGRALAELRLPPGADDTPAARLVLLSFAYKLTSRK